MASPNVRSSTHKLAPRIPLLLFTMSALFFFNDSLQDHTLPHSRRARYHSHHLSALSYRPVDLPERRLRTPGHHFLRSIRSAGLEPNGPCRRSATAPSIPTTSIHRTSSTSATFFILFLLSHRHHVQIAISRCFLSASLRILCSVHSDFR